MTPDVDIDDPAIRGKDVFDYLLLTQWGSSAQIEALQRRQLTKLVLRARNDVLFYRDRLAAVCRSDGGVHLDRWSDLPTMNRSDIQARGSELTTELVPKLHRPLSSVRSSGSTGVPVQTVHTRIEARAGAAAIARAYTWHGIDPNRDCLDIHGDNPEQGVWPQGTLRGQWGPRWLPDRRGQLWELNLLTSPEQALEFLVKGRFAYLGGLPSRIEAIAYAALASGVRVRLEAILTRGQGVTANQRRLFSDVFGAHVVALYSSQETGAIAHPCPECGQYHVNAELMLVEIVDAEGRPTAQGQPGEVAVTPFFNSAQPLIRYRLGDIATPGVPCACGRGLPTIEKILGRTYQFFRRADGTVFMPAISENRLAALGAGMWQLAQTATHRAEFRFTSRPGTSLSPIEDFVAAVTQALPQGFDVDVRQLHAFPSGLGGKHLIYVCELSV